MRPIERHIRERQDPMDRTEVPLKRKGPPCTEFTVSFRMPDGSIFKPSGLFPSNDHLPLDVILAGMIEEAQYKAHAIAAGAK